MKYLGCIIKVIILVIIILGGLYIYLTCAGQSCLVQRIDKMLPEALKASYEVNTRNPPHIFYAEEAVKNENGDVTMVGWYDLVKDKYVFHKDSIRLEKKVYGKIEIKRR